MSAISFSFPAILIGERCDDSVVWMRIRRNRKRCPDAKEEPDCSLYIHPATEVLLQKRDAWLWVRLEVMHSSACQLRTRPASLI